MKKRHSVPPYDPTFISVLLMLELSGLCGMLTITHRFEGMVELFGRLPNCSVTPPNSPSAGSPSAVVKVEFMAASRPCTRYWNPSQLT
ncbi:hypothetical protein ACFL44_03745 [Gemmatimonadota bacterium]